MRALLVRILVLASSACAHPDVATDGDPNACAAGVAVGTPCAMAGATCTAHCTACGADIFTTDPDALLCQDDPASPGTLRWVTFDEIDCFPSPGACGGMYTDRACTIAMECPACGSGAICGTPSDCCNGTTCVGGRCSRAPTCHVGNEECTDGIACCGDRACGEDGRCPPGSCQPAGAACWRGAECCFATGGCNSDTGGTCLPA
jgi:hypothetical protein